jgi:hypothetical protein
MADEPFVMKGDFSEKLLKSIGFEEVKELPLYNDNEIGYIIHMPEPVGKKYLEIYRGVEQPGSSLGS